MDKIPISRFKAKYLAILKRLRKTNQPICLTRFGQPIAEIQAISKQRTRNRRLGTLRGSLVIHTDIDAPISSEEDWDAARGVWEPEPHNKKSES
jgi:antitoxin (DNA-binding transcriptional repressor) of toxin-antitoxin stability system